MSSTTTRLALYKPDPAGTENVSVVTDVNNNMDNLDAKVGFVACTSGTRPGSPYNGQGIRETDTGKVYIWDGTAWRQIIYHTANFDQSIILPAVSQQIRVGGSASSASYAAMRTASSDYVFAGNITGDTNNRITVEASGRISIGPGGAASPDTNLYRSGTDALKTDDSFTAVGDLFTSGKVNIGTAAIRPRLSTTTTVANTVTETVIGAYTIPAADSVVGSVYRIKIFGEASVTGVPTLTFRFKLANTTLTNNSITVTASTGVTSHTWEAEVYVVVITTGAGGTVRGYGTIRESLSVAGSDPWTVINRQSGKLGGTTAMNTTASQDLQVTVQWSAASTLNTTTAYVVAGEKVS